MTGPQPIELEVNAERRTVCVRAADVLLDTLRDDLGLTGCKPGCENGDCGACTVLVDGLPAKACLMLTVEALGHAVETVEGLRGTEIQRAFVQCGAFQCGYCTSGFLMVCTGLVRRHPDADGARVLEWLRSNLCRCTGFQEIGDAVGAALGRDPKTDAAHAGSGVYTGGVAP